MHIHARSKVERSEAVQKCRVTVHMFFEQSIRAAASNSLSERLNGSDPQAEARTLAGQQSAIQQVTIRLLAIGKSAIGKSYSCNLTSDDSAIGKSAIGRSAAGSWRFRNWQVGK